jgi:hypothetical protein
LIGGVDQNRDHNLVPKSAIIVNDQDHILVRKSAIIANDQHHNLVLKSAKVRDLYLNRKSEKILYYQDHNFDLKSAVTSARGIVPGQVQDSAALRPKEISRLFWRKLDRLLIDRRFDQDQDHNLAPKSAIIVNDQDQILDLKSVKDQDHSLDLKSVIVSDHQDHYFNLKSAVTPAGGAVPGQLQDCAVLRPIVVALPLILFQR